MGRRRNRHQSSGFGLGSGRRVKLDLWSQDETPKETPPVNEVVDVVPWAVAAPGLAVIGEGSGDGDIEVPHRSEQGALQNPLALLGQYSDDDEENEEDNGRAFKNNTTATVAAEELHLSSPALEDERCEADHPEGDSADRVDDKVLKFLAELENSGLLKDDHDGREGGNLVQVGGDRGDLQEAQGEAVTEVTKGFIPQERDASEPGTAERPVEGREADGVRDDKGCGVLTASRARHRGRSRKGERGSGRDRGVELGSGPNGGDVGSPGRAKDEARGREEDSANGNAALEEGWRAVLDPGTNRYYYWNVQTGETTWEQPAKKRRKKRRKREVETGIVRGVGGDAAEEAAVQSSERGVEGEGLRAGDDAGGMDADTTNEERMEKLPVIAEGEGKCVREGDEVGVVDAEGSKQERLTDLPGKPELKSDGLAGIDEAQDGREHEGRGSDLEDLWASAIAGASVVTTEEGIAAEAGAEAGAGVGVEAGAGAGVEAGAGAGVEVRTKPRSDVELATGGIGVGSTDRNKGDQPSAEARGEDDEEAAGAGDVEEAAGAGDVEEAAGAGAGDVEEAGGAGTGMGTKRRVGTRAGADNGEGTGAEAVGREAEGQENGAVPADGEGTEGEAVGDGEGTGGEAVGREPELEEKDGAGAKSGAEEKSEGGTTDGKEEKSEGGTEAGEDERAGAEAEAGAEAGAGVGEVGTEYRAEEKTAALSGVGGLEGEAGADVGTEAVTGAVDVEMEAVADRDAIADSREEERMDGVAEKDEEAPEAPASNECAGIIEPDLMEISRGDDDDDSRAGLIASGSVLLDRLRKLAGSALERVPVCVRLALEAEIRLGDFKFFAESDSARTFGARVFQTYTERRLSEMEDVLASEESRADQERKESEARAELERRECEAKADREREENEAREAKADQERKESEARADRERKESEARADRERKESDAREAKADREREESEARASREREESEARASREREESEARAIQESEERETRTDRERKESGATWAPLEYEEMEAKAFQEREESEGRADREQDARGYVLVAAVEPPKEVEEKLEQGQYPDCLNRNLYETETLDLGPFEVGPDQQNSDREEGEITSDDDETENQGRTQDQVVKDMDMDTSDDDERYLAPGVSVPQFGANHLSWLRHMGHGSINASGLASVSGFQNYEHPSAPQSDLLATPPPPPADEDWIPPPPPDMDHDLLGEAPPLPPPVPAGEECDGMSLIPEPPPDPPSESPPGSPAPVPPSSPEHLVLSDQVSGSIHLFPFLPPTMHKHVILPHISTTEHFVPNHYPRAGHQTSAIALALEHHHVPDTICAAESMMDMRFVDNHAAVATHLPGAVTLPTHLPGVPMLGEEHLLPDMICAAESMINGHFVDNHTAVAAHLPVAATLATLPVVGEEHLLASTCSQLQQNIVPAIAPAADNMTISAHAHLPTVPQTASAGSEHVQTETTSEHLGTVVNPASGYQLLVGQPLPEFLALAPSNPPPGYEAHTPAMVSEHFIPLAVPAAEHALSLPTSMPCPVSGSPSLSPNSAEPASGPVPSSMADDQLHGPVATSEGAVLCPASETEGQQLPVVPSFSATSAGYGESTGLTSEEAFPVLMAEDYFGPATTPEGEHVVPGPIPEPEDGPPSVPPATQENQEGTGMSVAEVDVSAELRDLSEHAASFLQEQQEQGGAYATVVLGSESTISPVLPGERHVDEGGEVVGMSEPKAKDFVRSAPATGRTVVQASVAATATLTSVPGLVSSGPATASTKSKKGDKATRLKKRGHTTMLGGGGSYTSKKVSSLLSKWQAAKEEMMQKEDQTSDEDRVLYDPGALQRKKEKEIEEWRRKQLTSGEALDNSNFQPLGVTDWRERVKRARKASAVQEDAIVVSAVSTDVTQEEVAVEDVEPAVTPEDVSKKPDLQLLSKGLPEGWEAYWDESSQEVYYGNIDTRETSWEKPS